MNTYEGYLKAHPQTSRNRAERLMSDGDCYFIKQGKKTIGLMPGSSSMDELVGADPYEERCDCNVYRTKKACPHIAAALAMIEKNGGSVPYTDITQHVFSSLEKLKNRPSSIDRFAELQFLRRVKPFLHLLPENEKPRFVLELAQCYQSNYSHLTDREFVDCCERLANGYRIEPKVVELLYQNRKDCMKAAVALLQHSYSCPFSDSKKKTILKELAGNDKLAVKYLPFLASSYSEYFTREQLLRYYDTLKHDDMDPIFLADLLKRLVEEKPPLYEEFLKICNDAPNGGIYNLEFSAIEKVIEAGYGDRLGKIVEYMVDHIRNIEGYRKVISMVSHEAFLAAWKSRKQRNYWGWSSYQKPWEYVIDFIEDPDANPDKYDLDFLDCQQLEMILEARPEYSTQINQAVRKKYRQAVKVNRREEALEALMLLIRGDDAIAVKYATEWDMSRGSREELVYLISAGTRFDSLSKILPEVIKLEVPHAAGQDQ